MWRRCPCLGLFLVGDPFVSALVGDVWQYINPWRTIGKVGQVGMRERPELLERFGVWPAVLGFGAFTWFELVWADPARPSVLGVAAVIYTCIWC